MPPAFSFVHRARRVALSASVVLALAGCAPTPPAPAPEVSNAPAQGAAAAQPASVLVDLRTLVLDDGSASILALTDRLTREGVPFDRVALYGAHAPITAASLASTDASGVHARYAGIIAPALDAAGLSAAEHRVLERYRAAFKVRLIRTNTSAYFVRPSATGAPIATPATPVAGQTATVTSAGQAGPFADLRGELTLDAASDDVAGAVATLAARPPRLPADATYEPLVTVPIKGGGTGALVALQKADGLEELDVPLTLDPSQSQAQLLAHGMIAWVNRFVETGYSRNFYAVQVDDVLLPNAQWSDVGHCEMGRNCPPGTPDLEPIRMVPDDVDYLVDWQNKHGFKIDLAFNGSGAGEYAQAHLGRDPLMESLTAHDGDLRFVSHTWSHMFMGCHQVLLPDDWRCLADDAGQPRWRSERELRDQFVMNQEFAAKNHLTNFSADEVVTGEHSGLAKRPEQMLDNPNLGPALTDARMTWIASDASEPGDFDPRTLGSATTVPRYPIDLDYNTPTYRQAADQYNAIHVSKAQGGSGECEIEADNPCVAPISLDTGYLGVVVPWNVDETWQRVVADDPRPHFVHQTNLTSERTLYPIVEGVLARYRATYADNAPVVNPTLGQAGTQLVNAANWKTTGAGVQATVAGEIVTLTNTGKDAVKAPLTLPAGSTTVRDGRVGDAFGESYGGTRSAWVELQPGESVTFQLPKTDGFAVTATWTAEG